MTDALGVTTACPTDVTGAELDPGYVQDVKRMFTRCDCTTLVLSVLLGVLTTMARVRLL